MKYYQIIQHQYQCAKHQIQRQRPPILEPFQKSFFSISSTTSNTLHPSSSASQSQKRQTRIQIIGDQNEYDAVKQCRLIELPDQYHPQANLLASMHVKRNIIFGTRVHDAEAYLKYALKKNKGNRDELLNDDIDNNDDDFEDDNGRMMEKEDEDGNEDDLSHGSDMCSASKSTKNNWGFVKICKPLLKQCLYQAGVEGDQPQGLAALDGLSAHVRYMMDHPSQRSKAMELLQVQALSQNDDQKKLVYEAVQSIATQIPRAGHDVVGLGTYLDARAGWTQLAKEYALTRMGPTIVQGESQLFQSSGAVLVGIEYIGEENPNYWIDSGGAMARFVFV